MTVSPIFILSCFIFFLPDCFFAQEKAGDYQDINNIRYKHISSPKEGNQTIYYDAKGNTIENICQPGNPEYVRFADIQNTIYRLLSERLKDDTTRQKRSVDFCFAVSDKGVFNIRLISYEWSYTKDELQRFLEDLLKGIDLKTNANCTMVIEIPYWDYTLDNSKKKEAKRTTNQKARQ